jgi:hypothetical protein
MRDKEDMGPLAQTELRQAVSDIKSAILQGQYEAVKG